ncbi:MAG: endonuclease [Bacteroidetes bacterium]|nr:endonuclease [Bacteroidota bacterium]MBS1940670.1 endonuclease [Bacteroidota bacterium]
MFRIKLRTCLLLALAIKLPSAVAQPPAGYYDSAEGLSGLALKQALHNIIDNQDPLTYSGLWNAFSTTDATPANKVWDIYSDVPGGTPAYLYNFGSDQCGSYNSEGDCYNREHSFPQSWFNSQMPMNTDLFHLYPTDGYVNNMRGNLPYGDVGSADWTSTNGSKKGLCVDPGYNATVFEPIDAYKGDLARTYFYMMTRYYGQMSGWSSPVVQNGDLIPWNLAVMLQWNDLDPVSPKEIARNNAVYGLQENRNPFIDRPEWVHAIWGGTAAVAERGSRTMNVYADASGLHISRQSSDAGMLLVLDPMGRHVFQAPINGTQSDLAFTGAAGAYIAEVVTPNGRTVKRFVR